MGVFSIVSPPGRFTIGDLIDESVRAVRRLARPAAPPRPVWMPLDFLDAQKIRGWSDLPVWAPARDGGAGFAVTPAGRALAAGFDVRPLRTTVTDTLRWHLARPAIERESLKAGLAAGREAAALVAWRSRSA